MVNDKRQQRTGDLEQLMGHLYMIFGGNVVATFRITGRHWSLIKAVNERYRHYELDDDDDDEPMPPPLKVGGSGKVKDGRPHYFG